MALTRSKPTDIFTPEGNSLAVFIDVSDGEIKLKDVTGSVTPLSTFVSVNDGVLQTPNAIDGTLQVVQDQIGNDSALEISTDEIGLKASSTATTQTTAVIQATDTNSGIAIVPNGSGAFTLSVPDGTATGGDARGQYAVDLQRIRGTGGRVASGNYSVILGGSGNYATNTYSILVGGSNNRSDGASSSIVGGNNNIASTEYDAIVGGSNNNTSGRHGFIGGGEYNNISSRYSVVSGGQNNTASTNSHATVVGGYQNSSTGQYSVSGGQGNTASGQGSFALGYDNTASGAYSVALGFDNTASGQRSIAIGDAASSQGVFSGAFGKNVTAYNRGSIAIGYYSYTSADFSVSIGNNCVTHGQYSQSRGFRPETRLYGQDSFASGYFTSNGDAQKSTLISRKSDTLTTGATTTLSLDGTGTTNLIIPDGNNRAWNVKVETVAVVTSITGTATGVSVGDSLLQNDVILFSKIGGTSSVVGTNNTQFISSTSLSTALMVYSAGASQELSLTFTAPNFTGGGSVTMRVVSKVSLVEVAY